MLIVWQQLSKQVPMIMDTQATIKVLRYSWAITMENLFAVGSGPRLCIDDPRTAEENN
jgi:hypothetical protein